MHIQTVTVAKHPARGAFPVFRRNAFTLIEVLVCLLVIGVSLGSILGMYIQSAIRSDWSATSVSAQMMVAMAVLSLAIAAIITCNIAGLEFNEFVRPKVQNSQYARETLSRLIEEVRCANSTQVGTGTLSSFTAAAPNRPQRGNALRIL